MDPILNPFAPGAGSRPPAFEGREQLMDEARIAIERARIGNAAQNILMVGLRGVGKTVLLNEIRSLAEESNVTTLQVEAPEKKSLPAILCPELRTALLNLSKVEKAKDLAQRALRGLAGFAKMMKLKYNDIEVGFDVPTEPGLADNGDLEHDLQALFEASGLAAHKADAVFAVFIDELQYVKELELAALITALHRTAQKRLPVILIGAGLPQLRGKMGEAKSYSERLFSYPHVGPLSTEDAKDALVKPIRSKGADITPAAVELLLKKTECYPYFIQEWGKHAWDIALTSPITEQDVEQATGKAIYALDQSFFLVRFDRCTPKEKEYLRAMAELGPGPHRSGDIADRLNLEVTSLGPRRSGLIAKGMIWSPTHGETAFTVPMFDAFMKRKMPAMPELKP